MTSKPLSALFLAALVQVLPLPAVADEAVGSYLAARQARYNYDFAAAARYFTQALTEDPSNPAILENAVVAHMALGQFDRAIPVAHKMEADDLKSQISHMVLIAESAAQEDYDALLTRIEDERGMGPLADGLIAAWSYLGKGDMRTALEKFDEVADQRGLRSFALYHKALALASVGDFEGAEAIFSDGDEGPLQQTRRGVLAWAEVLSQLERNDDAIARIDEMFGGDLDPEVAQLRDRLVAGEQVPFARIGSAKDGLAEVFYSLGRALMSDTGGEYTLLYSRAAEYLNPGFVDAIIMSAELLESLDRLELAAETYRRVPRDDPSFHAAEMGRAETLRRADKTDAAIEVLVQLSQTHGDLPAIHVALADLYRQLERFDEAVAAYDRALDLYAERETEQWFVHYARAISHERLDNWPEAEADFRKALELNPGQPQVLNYLGYSLVEKQIKLDEALSLIEQAVASQPNSGYIVDSLGWVLYRLGRYDEAIGHMERAAELMPVDPVVNDHLGDVLWAVGRHTEAEFQWKRALSFVDKENPSPDIEPDRIRRKIEVGLDRVLAEEGAPPLKVADDND
ncbi:tetratricopeptide repeat protein [uncultured Roseovarius sp.]|uniref:tetratricopeptide repeat protein n=1 Tax=uncultured Roseovarius sp. TaxID=293344 RepID=UPI00259714CB|nr:tetratricopeptide repeat protein [uncultured Roseovarius sp.]